MTKITLSREIGCAADMFWKLFLQNDFILGLFKHLGFASFQILEAREDSVGVFRKVRGEPPIEAPALVQKLLGPKFGYVEEGRWTRADRTWTWTMVPAVLAERSDMRGLVRVDALGECRCRMNVEATVDVRLLGIGGLLESTGERSIRDGWARTAEYFNRILGDYASAAVDVSAQR